MPTVLAIWILLLMLGAHSLGLSWRRLREPLESMDKWQTPSVVVVAWLMRRCKPA